MSVSPLNPMSPQSHLSTHSTQLNSSLLIHTSTGVQETETNKDGILNMGVDGEQPMKKRMLSVMDIVWGLLNVGSCFTVVFSFNFFMAQWISKIYKIDHKTFNSYTVPLLVVQVGFVVLVQYRRLGMPNRLIGRAGKVVTNLIALGTAFILREIFPYDGNEPSIHVLLILLGLTLQLHSWLQVMHQTQDISVQDVLVDMIVEVAIYITGNILCAFIVIFFCGVICYKYSSYSTPITLEKMKKDLESLPV